MGTQNLGLCMYFGNAVEKRTLYIKFNKTFLQFFAKFLAKIEEKLCSICLTPIGSTEHINNKYILTCTYEKFTNST